MGHFFPLGKLAFWLETRIFGSHYVGYIAVNLALHATSAVLLNNWIRRHSGLDANRLVRLSVAAIYLTASSAIYSSQIGMQVKWHLSIVLTLAVLNTLARFHRFNFRVMVLVAMTILTFTGTSVTLLLLTGALETRARIVNRLPVSIIMLALAFLGGGVGVFLAEIWLPTDVNARGWDVDLGEILLGWRDVILWTSTVALTWLLAPISVVGVSKRSFTQEFGGYLQENIHVSAAIWVVVLLMVCLLATRSVSAFSNRIRILLTLGVVLFSSLLTVVFRLGNTRDFLAIRYGPLLLLISLFFWVLIVLQPSTDLFVRLVQRSLALLLVVTAITSIVRVEETVQRASDKERIDLTNAQNEEIRMCSQSPEIRVFRSIQNSLTGPELCSIASSIRGFDRLDLGD